MSSSQKLKRVLGGILLRGGGGGGGGGGGVEVQAKVVEVVERGGRSCRGEMLAVGVPGAGDGGGGGGGERREEL